MNISKYSGSQIIGILKQAETGTPVPELWRENGMSSATFYKLRAKYGGIDAPLTARLKELDDESRRLNEDVCRGTSRDRNRSGSPAKKIIKPARLDDVALNAVDQNGASIRTACAAVGISEIGNPINEAKMC